MVSLLQDIDTIKVHDYGNLIYQPINYHVSGLWVESLELYVIEEPT